jgi:hypothetical protein
LFIFFKCYNIKILDFLKTMANKFFKKIRSTKFCRFIWRHYSSIEHWVYPNKTLNKVKNFLKNKFNMKFR